MKRVIALLLSAALLASGLGSLAQAAESNVADVTFDTRWIYDAEDDIFNNGTVTGHEEWITNLHNTPDTTGEAVTATNLILATTFTFDRVGAEEDLITDPPPPPYKWFFGDIPEGSGRNASVGTNIPGTFPVDFVPGFDATLELSETHFLQANGSDQTQTLLLSVTPWQEQMLSIGVGLGEDDFVKPVHITPITDDMHISPDGHWLNIDIHEPDVGNIYTYTVTIEVTPKVPEIEFRPQVSIGYLEFQDQGTESGDSVSGEAPGVGDWTWSSTENYTWYWQKQHRLLVNWYGLSEQIGGLENEVSISFNTHYYYMTPDDDFFNHEVPGQREWATHLFNRLDISGDVIDSATVSLETGIEFENIERDNLDPDFDGPPLYQWSYSGIEPGGRAQASVTYGPSDPSPVSFEPGFNASRSFDKTTFDPGVTDPQWQTLTITVTPQEEFLEFAINVRIPENIPFVAYIESCDATTDHNISEDGHVLDIWEHEVIAGVTYTYEVKIQVEPGAYPVELRPSVAITKLISLTCINTGPLSSYEQVVAGMGTWEWDLSSAHPLGIAEQVSCGIDWDPNFDELINEVRLDFSTDYTYNPPDDTFYNHEVPGHHQWNTHIWNHLGNPEEVIENATVSLETEIVFNPKQIARDNLYLEGPPVYQWSYSEISAEDDINTYVSFGPDNDPSLVPFTPGFDASRTLDVTRFYEPGYQTLTITVTPRELVYPEFGIGIRMPEHTSIVAYIESCDATTDHNISEDGQVLDVWEHEVIAGVTYTYEVKIWVEPDAHPVEIRPFVTVKSKFGIVSPTDIGETSSYSHSVEDMPGTWTWNLYSEYPVSVTEHMSGGIRWEPHFEELINDVFMSFHTLYSYISPDDDFFNDDVPGQRQWGSILANRLGDPGDVIDDATVSLETGIEFQNINRDNLDFEGPPFYQWSYSGITPGARAKTFVSYEPNDPSPAPFQPGLNASRKVDYVRFDEPGWQTLEIKVTPLSMTYPWFAINVRIPENIPFVAYIDSCEGATNSNISPNGQVLGIWESQPNAGTEYVYTVKIRVEPGVFPVEMLPFVEIQRELSNIIESVGERDTYSMEVADLGEWTWTMSGEYPLSVAEQVSCGIRWEPHFEELVNEATVLFQTFWTHVVSGDEFISIGDVPGNISHVTQILNGPDNTGEPLSNVVLDLYTEEVFDRVTPPVTVLPDPTYPTYRTYQWSYEGIPEGDIRGPSVSVFPDPVDFTPGFDASRSVDQTVFSQPGTQTLTIKVTPRQSGAGALEMEMFIVDVFAFEDENVIPTILSVDGADGAFLNQDGHRLMMVKMAPEIGIEYTFTVTIEITPKVPQVKYRPTVRVYTPALDDGDDVTGNYVDYEMPDVGTWTCSADRDYQWSWLEGTARAVVFPQDSRIVIAEFSIEHMSVDFDNLRPNMDRIAISEATITLGEAATYDLTLDEVVVNIDGVVITIPAGSFIKKGINEVYHFESSNGAEPQINMELDFEKGEWRLKVSKIDASAIDNSDGVEITLSIGVLSATEVINMQVGGLTFIAGQ